MSTRSAATSTDVNYEFGDKNIHAHRGGYAITLRIMTHIIVLAQGSERGRILIRTVFPKPSEANRS